MKRSVQFLIFMLTAALVLSADDAAKAKPAPANVATGNARTNSAPRISAPSISRSAPSRSASQNFARPSISNFARPNVASSFARPNAQNLRPSVAIGGPNLRSMGSRPTFSQPNSSQLSGSRQGRPLAGSSPRISSPGNTRSSQRPAFPTQTANSAVNRAPSFDRGTIANRASGLDRAGVSDRSHGFDLRNSVDRANLANRANNTDRLSFGTRDRQASSDLLNRLNYSSRGGLGQVGALDRSSTRDRFGAIDRNPQSRVGGLDRVGTLDRFGAVDRAGAYRANRPVIGGDASRFDRGGDGIANLHRSNGLDVNNRFRGNNSTNFNRGDWGYASKRSSHFSGNHDRSDHWRDHYVNHHYHDWYHGDWNGHRNGDWGRNWYSPVVWGGLGWGLGANWYNSGWGYGPTYYNPYYTPVETPLYDYSLPLVVSSYAPDNFDADASFDLTPPVPAVPDNVQALQYFDAGTAQFKTRRYGDALANFDAALRLTPGDPVIHELRALSLFAQGRYTEAAATLNSLLATAPGMDWTTISNLYGDPNEYTSQLRRLEVYVRANRAEPTGWFVLAYQYLVIGDNDAAIVALKSVVELQPRDATAQRLLAALTRPDVAAVSPPAPAAGVVQQTGELPLTDLVGSWLAKNGPTQIELNVDDKSQFSWTATESGKPVAALRGVLSADNASVALQTSDHGTMAGTVKSISPDQFTFTMQGLPANDPGLQFRRAR